MKENNAWNIRCLVDESFVPATQCHRESLSEMRFASFLSGGFITAIEVNPLERKLAKRTSVMSQRIILKFARFLYYVGLCKLAGVTVQTIIVSSDQ
jgi:hypothetical protein